MITGEMKSRVDRIWDTMWSGGILYREFSKRAAGAVVKNLNTSLVKRVEILIPPLTEQKRIAKILDTADALRAKRRFATIVESIEQQKTRMRAHLAELDALFASLQSRAVNGEL